MPRISAGSEGGEEVPVGVCNNNGVTTSGRLGLGTLAGRQVAMTEILETATVTGTGTARGRGSGRPLAELAGELMARADADGVSLVGPGGLLAGLTKTVLESALEAEMTEHLGYEPYDPAGHHSGNSRNGVRTKTVLTDIGPVEVDVPRDRAGSFEPVIVAKRVRRLGGVDAMVCSLSAKGLTHGEISAHLGEIYGAKVSKETVTRITDAVMEGMVAWQNRPLDRVYPVIFIDAIVVKIREGQVANRPIYVAIGVTVDGERDILGLWAGEGGEGFGTVTCSGGRKQRAGWAYSGCSRVRACRGDFTYC